MSQKWLLDFIKQEYHRAPRNLNVRVPPESTGLILERLEADELWSFVGKKKNQVWIWLAMDAATRQIVAVHAGGRSEQDAKAFWARRCQNLTAQVVMSIQMSGMPIEGLFLLKSILL